MGSGCRYIGFLTDDILTCGQSREQVEEGKACSCGGRRCRGVMSECLMGLGLVFYR